MDLEEHLKKPTISFFEYEETEITDINSKENLLTRESEAFSEIKTALDYIGKNSDYYFIKEINQEYEKIYISKYFINLI